MPVRFAWLFLMLVAAAHAQVATEVRTDVESPIVQQDRTVTFKYVNTAAKDVRLSADFRYWVTYPEVFTKQDSGVWTLTTPPVPPGIYRYNFIVDGRSLPDELNPDRRYNGAAPHQSMLLVPGAIPQPWEIHPDIPHGQVVEEQLYSKTFERLVSCFIYLPPGYHESQYRYPILYLQHGRGDDTGNWIYDGWAARTADYQIAKMGMQPMIIVCPDGNVYGRAYRGKQEPAGIKRDLHERYFITELMPFVEGRYRVEPSKRAIAGLSMGGGQTCNIALRNPLLFTAVGPFSAATIHEFGTDSLEVKILAQKRDELNRWKVFYIPIGDKDFLLEMNQQFVAILKQAGIQHEYYVEPGVGHCWPFWTKQAGIFMMKFSDSLK